ncbi:MAG: valine--pyruvate transaminase [Cellvibrionales bacterium]|nr:MAG: valine--pyruvate transaminase [Cellvibrionales bacterium]
MKFSQFGHKFSQKTGALQLMDDLAYAAGSGQIQAMLGGGNPARIPEVEAAYQQAYSDLGAAGFSEVVASYSGSQGDAAFLQTLADFFNRQYDWGITPAHIAITNGSQNAFFYLFNLFSGAYEGGQTRQILLPLVPEYLGYADVHVDAPHFVAARPQIEATQYRGQAGFFKYRIDFAEVERLLAAGDVGAICCSRPTNPSGNVLTDAEIARLSALAASYDIPLIVDYAYGEPFPGIQFTPVQLSLAPHHILCFSLSKTGLPSLRTGIVVAAPEVIAAISALNATLSLAPGRLSAAIARPLLAHDGKGSLRQLSQEVIRPFYQARADFAIDLLRQELAGYPLRIHQPEGAIFLWLWFEGLPISTNTLYEELKAAGTLVVPGAYYFPGIDTSQDRHAHECLRMSYAQDEATLRIGISSIARLVKQAYQKGKDHAP